jgi:hypothetical protein
MRSLLAILLLVPAIIVEAQTVATTANVLHPIMKDPNKRLAPTSLDRDPSTKAEFMTPTPKARGAAARAATAPAKPLEIVAQIDGTLTTGTISLIGTISGLKGRLYVTNTGSQVVVPKVQIAFCDRNGLKIGTTAKTGEAIAPNGAEKIEILATNVSTVDMKLIRLSGSGN